MTRSLVASALLFAASPALAGSGVAFYDVCNSTVRSPADEVACICAARAAKADTDGVAYDDWWDGFSYAGGTKSVNGVAYGGSTAESKANDSCFDLIDHVNAGSTSMGDAYLGKLHDWAKAAAAEKGDSYRITTSDSDGDMTDDFVDSFMGFGNETSVDLPHRPIDVLWPIPFDPFHTEVVGEQGSMGVVETQGQEITGAYLEDVNHDGEMDAVLFMGDEGNAVLLGVGPGMTYHLPPMGPPPPPQQGGDQQLPPQ